MNKIAIFIAGICVGVLGSFIFMTGNRAVVVVAQQKQADYRKRTLVANAKTILTEAKIMDGAIQQVAFDRRMKGSDRLTFEEIKGELPSVMIQRQGRDILGNPYQIMQIADRVRVSPITVAALREVVDDKFWGEFLPKPGEP